MMSSKARRTISVKEMEQLLDAFVRDVVNDSACSSQTADRKGGKANREVGKKKNLSAEIAEDSQRTRSFAAELKR